MTMRFDRRQFLLGSAAATGALALAGCAGMVPRSETAAARALYDSIFEGMLRASPEMATGLGLDTGERAYLQAPAAAIPRRPARWAPTSRCSTICPQLRRIDRAALSRAASAPGSTPSCGSASAWPTSPPSPMAASAATAIRSPTSSRS